VKLNTWLRGDIEIEPPGGTRIRLREPEGKQNGITDDGGIMGVVVVVAV